LKLLPDLLLGAEADAVEERIPGEAEGPEEVLPKHQTSSKQNKDDKDTILTLSKVNVRNVLLGVSLNRRDNHTGFWWVMNTVDPR
jgi:hypothetical protein